MIRMGLMADTVMSTVDLSF